MTFEGRRPSSYGVIESLAETLFGAEQRLAVYGSLIPGKENHHIVSDIEGEWTKGYIRGVFLDRGWGAGVGYPAIRWVPEGDEISVHVLTAPSLPNHWNRLDYFEGSDYQRILVPVYSEVDPVVVCNLYELRSD